MKSIFVLLFLITSVPLLAQDNKHPDSEGKQQHQHDPEFELNEVVITSNRLFVNDTARYRYNQLKLYVRLVLPYVDTAVTLFHQIDETTKDMSTRQRRLYIRSQEQAIKTHFEDRLSALNITQGRLLVKIINRQLERNCYSILRELRNPVTAAYYQSVARLNGINLNETYLPEENPELEMILRTLGYPAGRKQDD